MPRTNSQAPGAAWTIRRILGAAILCAVALGAAAQPSPTQVADLYDQLRGAFGQGDYARMKEIVGQLEKIDPDNPRLMLYKKLATEAPSIERSGAFGAAIPPTPAPIQAPPDPTPTLEPSPAAQAAAAPPTGAPESARGQRPAPRRPRFVIVDRKHLLIGLGSLIAIGATGLILIVVAAARRKSRRAATPDPAQPRATLAPDQVGASPSIAAPPPPVMPLPDALLEAEAPEHEQAPAPPKAPPANSEPSFEPIGEAPQDQPASPALPAEPSEDEEIEPIAFDDIDPPHEETPPAQTPPGEQEAPPAKPETSASLEPATPPSEPDGPPRQVVPEKAQAPDSNLPPRHMMPADESNTVESSSDLLEFEDAALDLEDEVASNAGPPSEPAHPAPEPAERKTPKPAAPRGSASRAFPDSPDSPFHNEEATIQHFDSAESPFRSEESTRVPRKKRSPDPHDREPQTTNDDTVLRSDEETRTGFLSDEDTQ